MTAGSVLTNEECINDVVALYSMRTPPNVYCKNISGSFVVAALKRSAQVQYNYNTTAI